MGGAECRILAPRDRGDKATVHLVSLDGLRGVAALAVVGSHFENLSGISLHLQHAGVAVDFFFMLSGFVIGQAYEGRLAGGLGWRRYMGLRLRRLYPAIIGALAVGLVVAVAAGEPLFPALGLQLLVLPVFWGPVLHGGELFPLDGPQWSLFLELAVNAFHAAASRWLTIGRLGLVVALAGAVLAPVSLHFGGLDVGWARQNVWGGPPRVVFGFGMGLLIFRLRARGWSAPRIPYPFVVLGLVLCLARPFPETGLYALTDLVIVLAALPFLVALAVSAAVPAPLVQISAWLGALSYPLYAIHAPLLRGCETVLDTWSPEQERLGWGFAGLFVILLAAVFERAYDRPIRSWLGRPRGRPAP